MIYKLSKFITMIHSILINGDYMEIINENNVQCNFENLFINNNFEELHNAHSMAILGDSLEIMKQIKDKSINLIFADAPYNIGKDFGNNKDRWNTLESYIEWCLKQFTKIINLIKSFYIFNKFNI